MSLNAKTKVVGLYPLLDLFNTEIIMHLGDYQNVVDREAIIMGEVINTIQGEKSGLPCLTALLDELSVPTDIREYIIKRFTELTYTLLARIDTEGFFAAEIKPGKGFNLIIVLVDKPNAYAAFRGNTHETHGQVSMYDQR